MIARVFLTLLGAMLLLWGVGMPLVAWFGPEAQGTITHVRRQLGDRGEAIPNRYSYAIAYEFRLPDGSTAQGNTYRIGDYFSPRNMAVGRVVRVRYLPGLPWVSDIQTHWAASWEHFVVAVVGAVLIVLALRAPADKGKSTRSRQPRTRKRAISASRKG